MKWQEVEKSPGVYVLPESEKEKLRKIKASGLNILGIFMGRVSFYDGGANPHTDEGIKAFTDYCTFMAMSFAELLTIGRYGMNGIFRHSTRRWSPPKPMPRY